MDTPSKNCNWIEVLGCISSCEQNSCVKRGSKPHLVFFGQRCYALHDQRCLTEQNIDDIDRLLLLGRYCDVLFGQTALVVEGLALLPGKYGVGFLVPPGARVLITTI